MLHTLMRRLEIIRAAISLADEALLAQQLPALHAAQAQLPATAAAALAGIIDALHGGHYPQAVRLINRFLQGQSALVAGDEQLAALRLELAALERQVAAQTLERDEILAWLERFNRDILLFCGPVLAEILLAKEQLAKLQLEHARHQRQAARHATRREEQAAGYQAQAQEEYLQETAADTQTCAQAQEKQDTEDEAHAATLADYAAYCDWLDEREDADSPSVDTPEDEAEQAAQQSYEEAQRQREDFGNEQAQAQAAEQDIATLGAEDEARLKAAYRRACQLCHPDRVSTALKTQAEAMFKALGEAYKKKNLAEVERILAQAQRGIFTAASDTLSDRDSLQQRIAELRARIAELQAEIAALHEDESYRQLQAFFDDEAAYQAYLDEQRNALESELARLYAELQAAGENEDSFFF